MYTVDDLVTKAAFGSVQDVQRILDSGVNVNAQHDLFGITALHSAAIQANVDIVKLLLSRGANVNIKDNDKCTPLSQAKRGGNQEIIRMLMDKGARE